MSNFSLFNFNISKATPTTSTTNTNTTSLPVSIVQNPTASGEDCSKMLPDTFSASLKLHKGSSETSPNFGSVNTTSALVGPSSGAHLPGKNITGENQDLISIFGKFNIDAIKNLADIDLLEEKFDQFKEPEQSLSPIDNDIKKVKKDDLIRSDEEAQTVFDAKNKSRMESFVQHGSSGAENDQTETPNFVEVHNDLILGDHKSNVAKAEAVDQSLNKNLMAIQPYVIEKTTINYDAGSKTKLDSELSTSTDIPAGFHEKAHIESTNDFLALEDGESVEEVHLEVTKKQEFPALVQNHTAQRRPCPLRKDSIAKASKGIVNASEQHQQSHRPFDFQTFLSHLKKKSADPIVRYIRSFLMSFARQTSAMSATQMSKAIRNFKLFIEGKFRVYEPFASMDETDLENSVEGVEKLIMNRLYEFCFPPEATKKFEFHSPSAMSQDLSDDREFSAQIEKFSWILGVHLDVNLDDLSERKRRASKDDVDYMEYAARELNKINDYRAPRDKIICILNACKILFSLLRITDQETNADSFIPLLILVILRSKTKNIICNLHYIERFRGEKWLNHGETSYYLSTVQGAIIFIQNIKREDLTIDQTHYDAHMEAWEAELRQKSPKQTIPKKEILESSSEVASRQKLGILPSNVLMASAEIFTKSISNLISNPEEAVSASRPTEEARTSQEQVGFTDNQVGETFNQLCEIFPSLDKDIMRDVVIMNGADFEVSLDVCLQLVNDD